MLEQPLVFEPGHLQPRRECRRSTRRGGGRGTAHAPRASAPSTRGRSSGACRRRAPSWASTKRDLGERVAAICSRASRDGVACAAPVPSRAPRRTRSERPASSSSPIAPRSGRARRRARVIAPPSAARARPAAAARSAAAEGLRTATRAGANPAARCFAVAAESSSAPWPESATVTCSDASSESARKPSAERSASGSSRVPDELVEVDAGVGERQLELVVVGSEDLGDAARFGELVRSPSSREADRERLHRPSCCGP